MTNARWKRTVVIGGGMAGLFAARVLSDFFEEVIIVERDTFPDQPAARPGTPQDGHTHSLLARGRQVVERLYPGFDQELAAQGVPLYTWGIDTRILTTGGYIRQRDTGITVRGHSRLMLEWVVRCLTGRIPNVNFHNGEVVTGLVVHHDRVQRIELKATHGQQPATLESDLVVDASGRNSKVVEWLVELGYPRPPEESVNPLLGYATRWYRAAPGKCLDIPAILIQPGVRPGLYRGAAGGEVEDGQILITLLGMNGDYPPTDEAGFAEFARSLPDRTVENWLEFLEPIGPIYGFRATNRLRHFEHLKHYPERLIVMGDAVCALNPIYGQGMTVAAQQAELLQQELRRVRSLEGLAHRFHRHLVNVHRIPWLMATGEDRRYPLTEGPRPNAPERLLHRYFDLLFIAAAHDSFVAQSLIKTLQMLMHPVGLFHPRVVAGVLLTLVRGTKFQPDASTG